MCNYYLTEWICSFNFKTQIKKLYPSNNKCWVFPFFESSQLLERINWQLWMSTIQQGLLRTLELEQSFYPSIPPKEGTSDRYMNIQSPTLLSSKTKNYTSYHYALLLTRKKRQYFLVRVRRSISLHTGYCWKENTRYFLGKSDMTNKYAHKQSFTKQRQQNYANGAWHKRKGEQFIMLSMKGGKSMHVWVGRKATSTWKQYKWRGKGNMYGFMLQKKKQEKKCKPK